VAKKIAPEEAKAVNKLLEVLGLFRKINPIMSTQQIAIFLEFVLASARQEEAARSGSEGDTTALAEVCKRLDLAQSTASRILGIWAGLDPKYPVSPPMLRVYENPLNRRSKLIELTHDGRVLLNSILKIFGR
jgi:DNA-binding MarR family transcriptional regulator